MSDVFLYLSPSTKASGSSPQFIVQESASGLVPSSDVTKVHSYSLASAAVSALSSSCDMQKVVISTQENHLQGTGLPHKAILNTPAHTQIRTGTKRLASVSSSESNTLSSVNTVIDIMSLFHRVNKLLSGLTSSSDGRIYSSPKSKIMDHFTKKLRLLKFKYYLLQAEYFFLKNGGGNIMDCLVSKKKLPIELLQCLIANKLDSYDDIEVIIECLLRACAISITASEPTNGQADDDDDDDGEDDDDDDDDSEDDEEEGKPPKKVQNSQQKQMNSVQKKQNNVEKNKTPSKNIEKSPEKKVLNSAEKGKDKTPQASAKSEKKDKKSLVSLKQSEEDDDDDDDDEDIDMDMLLVEEDDSDDSDEDDT